MIVFHSLEKGHLKEIVSMMSNALTKRLKEQDISLELTDAALEKIADEGYDPQYGARPIRRALQKQVEDRLSEELLKGNVEKGNQVIIDYVNDEFVVKKKKRAFRFLNNASTYRSMELKYPLNFTVWKGSEAIVLSCLFFM